MKIRVTLEQAGHPFAGHPFRIFAEPEPAFVLVGEPLFWEFVTDLPNQPIISWLVYFTKKSPFVGPISLAAVSQELAQVLHVGQVTGATHLAATTQVVVQTPGDYKYGVKATVTGTGFVLGDDDPDLYVRP